MSTGPEHYQEAERLLAKASEAADWQPLVAQAQVHATLAQAAAAAYPAVQAWLGDEHVQDREWTKVL